MGLSRAELRDRVDLGKIFDVTEDGVADGRLAHLSREGDVAPVIEVLGPEEDDLPAQKRVVDGIPRRHIQRPTEIDVRDLGADVQCEGLHLSHGRLLDDL
jgi:hypothetical protein